MVILRGRQPCGARFEHRFLHGHPGGLLLFYRVYSRAGTVYGCGKPIYLCGVVCGRAGHCRGRCWLFGLHCYFKRCLGATAPKPLTDIAPPVFAENFLANRLICVMIMNVRRRASIFCFPLLPEITKPAFPPRTPEKASVFASVARVDLRKKVLALRRRVERSPAKQAKRYPPPPRTPEKASIFASVAQVDRAFGSDPEGRWFESSRAHQAKSLEKPVVMRFSGLFVFCFSFRKSC